MGLAFRQGGDTDNRRVNSYFSFYPTVGRPLQLQLHRRANAEIKIYGIEDICPECIVQSDLKPNQISIEESKFIFLLRTRMLDVKVNFRNKHNDLLCRNCKSFPDDQHLVSGL